MPIQKSYKNKIVDFGLNTGTLKGDDGRDVEYSTLVVELEIDGNIEKVNLSGSSAPKPALLGVLLRSAKDQNPDAGLLEDN